ncbi:unnamed protein product [Trichogramma brassicae]|uniref:Uncharacterized protein n=1 Tax=Trichogramma brassicae TaxID=86971 RepID=A0A6H5J758_9HYME|nr:unnamed protein product [Trichogramma brassicae]
MVDCATAPPLNTIDGSTMLLQTSAPRLHLLAQACQIRNLQAPTLQSVDGLPNRSVCFAWIPSHIGVRGNEAVNALARAATCSDSADHPPVAFSDLAELFRRDCRVGSISECENDGRSKGKTYFELYHHRNSASPWYSNRGLTRAFIVTINRMRTNHHSLPSLSTVKISSLTPVDITPTCTLFRRGYNSYVDITFTWILCLPGLRLRKTWRGYTMFTSFADFPYGARYACPRRAWLLRSRVAIKSWDLLLHHLQASLDIHGFVIRDSPYPRTSVSI